MRCKNCGNEFEGQFCNQCGQSSSVGKFTFRNLLEEISTNIFQINHGFFYTLKNLFKRPGQTIREYLDGQRKRSFRPITYVLVISTFYFILNRIFEIDNIVDDAIQGQMDAYNDYGKDAKDLSFMQWFSDNFAYTILLLIPLFALANFMSFIKRGQNYIEHFIITTYIVAQQLIIWISMVILEIVIGTYDSLDFIAFILSAGFKFWTYIQFYKKHNKFVSGLLVLLSYIIFIIITFLIAGIVNLIW